MKYKVKVGDMFIPKQGGYFLYNQMFRVTNIISNEIFYTYTRGAKYSKPDTYFTDEFLEPVPSLVKELF